MRRATLGAVLIGIVAVASSPAAERAVPVSVEIHNLADRALERVPVTFGQVFRAGDVPPAEQVHCAVDGGWAQVDPKRRYKDGSLRFAVVSAVLPHLSAGESETLELAVGGPRPSPPPAPPVSLKDLLETDFDAVVTFRFPDGAVRSASARKLLIEAGEKAATWLEGHVAAEWLVSGPPADEDGRPDEDLSVRFHVRAYAGLKRARVAVVVENCWDHWAGNVRYDASVTVGGRGVFSRSAVDHRRLSRWRKVFWWGRPAPEIHVAHDPAYMSATGALPHYDVTLEIPPRTRAQESRLRMEGPDWQILGKGALTAYMPTTGGRPEIAPYPAWTVRYLLGMDPAQKALVLAGGDLAGSWPIHVRARGTDRVMTIDERPKFWLDARGSDKPQWKPPRHEPGPGQIRLTPDLAHQGSFAYAPYLVTGDYYYLEEAYFWANYCLLASWPHPRRDAEGILAGQIRGNGWALRNLADAAWIAPDGHPEADYFDEKIRNNLADRTARMIGPPEYNRFGFWGIRTAKTARIQNPANPRWMVSMPWQLDYVIWSLHHLVELGHAEAAGPRDFLLRLRVGMLTNAPKFDPTMSTPYKFVVGEQSADGEVAFYEDWETLARENAKLYEPELPNYGNSYAYSARAAVIAGLDGGFPKAAEALRWLEDHLPDHRQVMAREPYWAIVPRPAETQR
ncbi:MAG: hypothetical protein ACYTG0_01205 [Planctomycetota bacterium]|jgi:hypothetical protein